jgi:para-aminobenzoate synthetase
LDAKEGEEDLWHIEAAGAVTILSTAEGKAEEIFTKFSGSLKMFQMLKWLKVQESKLGVLL